MTEHGNRTPLRDMLHVHYSQQHNQAAPSSYFREERVRLNKVTEVLKVITIVNTLWSCLLLHT